MYSGSLNRARPPLPSAYPDTRGSPTRVLTKPSGHKNVCVCVGEALIVVEKLGVAVGEGL